MPVSVRAQQFRAQAAKAQKAHLQIIRELQPTNALGAAVKGVAIGAHAYAVKMAHKDTGNLKRALRIDPYRGSAGPGGRTAWTAATISVGPKPHERTYIPANIYGFWEHERGGDHAFFERTVREAGVRLVRAAGNELALRLPRGD